MNTLVSVGHFLLLNNIIVDGKVGKSLPSEQSLID